MSKPKITLGRFERRMVEVIRTFVNNCPKCRGRRAYLLRDTVTDSDLWTPCNKCEDGRLILDEVDG